MKSVAAIALIAGGASASSVDKAHLALAKPHGGSLLSIESSDKHVHHVRASSDIDTNSERGVAHFGDTTCPCIGFDNIDGETTVTFETGAQVDYPADLGARCEAWDDGLNPACKEGETPGPNNGWCGQKWCYVDACNCDIPVLPKTSSYVPDARYRGRPIFFSYATCGGEDTWSEKLPEVGSAGCRCIGFDNIPGTTDVTLRLDGGRTQTVSYPAEIGGTCQAWDEGVHPACHSKDPPKWCSQKWCYVDPCSCDIGTHPKVTMYLPEATFTGKSLYYSYETCGSKDHFTEHFNTEACVNQKSEDDCLKLKTYAGGSKCAWTAGTCLGWEITEHPLCKSTLKAIKKEHSASPRSSVATFAAGAAGAAAAAVAHGYEL